MASDTDDQKKRRRSEKGAWARIFVAAILRFLLWVLDYLTRDR